MAAMISLHRMLHTWHNTVDAFIALTEFQKTTMAAAGLPLDRIHVKPHFHAAPPLPAPWNEREPKVIYIGRLGDYKGVHILIEAWLRWGVSAPLLEIIGEGPERKRLESMANGSGVESRIRFTGQLDSNETQQRLALSRLLVLPSLCFEGFPMVIGEAFALGVPVAGSRLGSIPCIVNDGGNGVLFAANDAGTLLAAVKALWEQSGTLETMGRAARESFDLNYTSETNYRQLMAIYKQAREHRKQVAA
jgi:glycosyltransferase involved in cell wall biosynthesis